MAEEVTTTQNAKEEKPTTVDVKGKGKAVEEKPIEVEDEEMDSGDEDEDMDDVEEDEDEPEDDLAEIDPSNIVSRRTRGKKIDYAKEAEAAGNELDDDEEDDEEYTAPPEDGKN